MSKFVFESKSQQLEATITEKDSCLSECQSSFLKANHNPELSAGRQHPIVYQNVKVRFESKSQRIPCAGVRPVCCLSECQSSFLKANHNNHLCDIQVRSVVYQNVKVRF